MQREHHFFIYNNTHEYWECPNHLSDWHKVDAEHGADWRGDTYEYYEWHYEPNMMRDNYPPRIFG